MYGGKNHRSKRFPSGISKKQKRKENVYCQLLYRVKEFKQLSTPWLLSGWQCQQASQSTSPMICQLRRSGRSIFDIRILFILCFFHARCRFELLFSIQSAYLIQSITICHALIYCFGLVLIETFIVLPTKDTNTERGREGTFSDKLPKCRSQSGIDRFLKNSITIVRRQFRVQSIILWHSND